MTGQILLQEIKTDMVKVMSPGNQYYKRTDWQTGMARKYSKSNYEDFLHKKIKKNVTN